MLYSDTCHYSDGVIFKYFQIHHVRKKFLDYCRVQLGFIFFLIFVPSETLENIKIYKMRLQNILLILGDLFTMSSQTWPDSYSQIEVISYILKNFGQPKFILVHDKSTTSSTASEFAEDRILQFAQDQFIPFKELLPEINITSDIIDEEIFRLISTFSKSKFNPAIYSHLLLLPTSSLRKSSPQPHPLILFNSVTLLIRDTPKLPPIFSNSFPLATFLLSSAGPYQICHFCSLHNYHAFRKITPHFQTSSSPLHENFHLAPIYIGNLGQFSGKIPPRFLTPQRNRVNLITFLAVNVQLLFNLTVYAVPSSEDDNGMESVIVMVLKSTANPVENLFSFGEKKEITFITKRQPHPFDWTWIKGPFEPQVLIHFALAFVIMSIFIYLIVTLLNDCGLQISILPFTISSSFELILRLVLDQHLEKLPSSRTPFRVAFCSWLLCCLVVTETYRGEIVGHFVKPLYLDGPLNFLTLGQSGNFFVNGFKIERRNTTSWISNVVRILEMEFEARNLKKYGQILDKFKTSENRFLETPFDAYKRLVFTEDAFIEETTRLEMFVGMDIAKNMFQLGEDSIARYAYTIVMKNVFSRNILSVFQTMVDSGLIQEKVAGQRSLSKYRFNAMMKKMIKNETDGVREELEIGKSETHVPLTIYHVKNVYIIKDVFYGVAAIILVLECVMDRYHMASSCDNFRCKLQEYMFVLWVWIRLKFILLYIYIFSEFPQWVKT